MEAAIPSQEINPGELGDLGGVNSDRYCIYLVLRESTFQNLARDQGGLQVGLFGSVSPYSLEQNSEQEHAISRTAQPSCVSASIHYPSLTPHLNWTCSFFFFFNLFIFVCIGSSLLRTGFL